MSIYVWTEPTPLVEYDFKNKDAATLQSDGWTLEGSATLTFNSNGVTANGTYTIYKTIDNSDFANANQIIIEYDCYKGTRSSTNGTLNVCMNTHPASGNTYVGGLISAYQSMSGRYLYYGTSYANSSIDVSVGNRTCTITFDFVNKVATYHIAGYTDLTQSLTDSIITFIKARTDFGAILGKGNYLTSFKLTVV